MKGTIVSELVEDELINNEVYPDCSIFAIILELS